MYIFCATTWPRAVISPYCDTRANNRKCSKQGSVFLEYWLEIESDPVRSKQKIKRFLLLDQRYLSLIHVV